MKLISFQYQKGPVEAGVIVDNKVYALHKLHSALAHSMLGFLGHWDAQMLLLKTALEKLAMGRLPFTAGVDVREVSLLAPLQTPRSLRDGYAFRQHVEAARRNRGLGMIEAYDEYPVFYFNNPYSVCGPGVVECMPDHFCQLDFELECAIVICRQGINISAAEADGYIGGLMIMNDLSARTLQREEMLLNLGPAKGKDFATTMGPHLITLDALADREVPCKDGHAGKSWQLSMKAFVNGAQVSKGNLADMDWTFAELIERASYGVMLKPGDVIGSGTVGTGCFLELNGAADAVSAQWLEPGDTIELEIEGLGRLSNTVVRMATDYSILEKKKICVSK